MKQQTLANKIEWKEVELGNKTYFEIASSGIDNFNGKKDYLSTESIKGTKIAKIECKISYLDRPSRANMQPISNSVWFAKMKSTIKVYSFSKENVDEIEKYILSTGFAGIKVNDDLYSKYVRFFFLTNRFNEEKDKLSTGSTQSGINNYFIEKIKISLPFSNGKPDLKEQERIVKILEKAEKQKERIKNTNDLLDEYLKSVFNELFGDPNKNDKKFTKTNVGKVCGCIVPGRDKPKSFTGNIPWVTTEDLNFLGVTYKSKKNIGLTKDEIKNVKAKIIPKNSVLLTCVGDLGIVSLSGEEIVINQQLHAFQCPESINSRFLMYALSLQKRYMHSRATSTTLPYMNKTACNSIPVIIPPLPLQQKFASIVEHVEGLKEKIKKTKQNSDEFFNSLTSKAFNGELK